MYALGIVFLRVITALFFIGLAGSAVVIAISFVEDFRELFGPDEPHAGSPESAAAALPQKRSA